MRVLCPKCGGEVGFSPELSGRVSECPHCKTVFRMPAVDIPEARVVMETDEPAKSLPYPPPPPMPPPLVTSVASDATAMSSLSTDAGDPPKARLYVAPPWMMGSGWVALIVGVVGAIASFFVNEGAKHPEIGLVSAILNPMFFVGVPLAIYWINRATDSGRFEVCPHCERRLFRHAKPTRSLTCPVCNKRYIPA